MAGVRTFSRYRVAILSLSELQWKYPEQLSTVFPIKPLSVVSKKSHTYRDSGVDIEAGENLVNSIKDMVSETHTHQVLSNIGGFGALFAPDLSGYEEPVFEIGRASWRERGEEWGGGGRVEKKEEIKRGDSIER